MTQPGPRTVEHEITISAPARAVYQLLAQVANWPRIFPPTLHVEQLAQDERSERIQIWATANGEPKNWTSRRTLDPEGLRIDFRQEVSAPPVASMGGAWVIEPLSAHRSRVRLLHDYRAVDDDPDKLQWIERAVDDNSRQELAALKTNIEADQAAGEWTFSFEDTVHIDGTTTDVYDFINDAHQWPDHLPHVATVDLTETTPGFQRLTMQTRAKDGSTHTTQSYRVCFPHRQIAYKQTTLPALMTLHTGRWTFQQHGSGVRATSQHTVVLNPTNITAVLGPDAGIPEATAYVRTALSTNSRATLGHAKDYAEARRPRP
ncbi:aromatase/cyclase [Streptomyces sp. NPDC057579]|uniref:aromatase/cyclase n=1 Tax=Streptomyces sp. NPDC057579 TaxID=3346172 RepID=UPI0036809EA4